MTVSIRKYKRGDDWEVDIQVTYPDGTTRRERIKAPVPSKSGARRWGEARFAALLAEGPQQPRSTKEVPTLNEFYERYLDGHARANRQKASTIRAKESIFEHHLLPRFGHLRLNEINDEAVQRLKAALGDRGRKTVNNVLTVLNTTLKVAVEWGELGKLPCRIQLLKVVQAEMSFYESETYEMLVEGARRIDPRAHLVVLLAGDAGLRQGEILALFQTDVDFRQDCVHVRRNDWQGHLDLPKGGRARRIPMTRRLEKALREHRHLRGERVLYRDDGKPYTRQTLRLLLIQAERRANLEAKGAVHKLRHTFCSRLAMGGAPARAIQEFAGHADLMTTQRYMHLSPAATQSAIRLLEGPSAARGFGDILETSEEARGN